MVSKLSQLAGYFYESVSKPSQFVPIRWIVLPKAEVSQQVLGSSQRVSQGDDTVVASGLHTLSSGQLIKQVFGGYVPACLVILLMQVIGSDLNIMQSHSNGFVTEQVHEGW